MTSTILRTTFHTGNDESEQTRDIHVDMPIPQSDNTLDLMNIAAGILLREISSVVVTDIRIVAPPKTTKAVSHAA